MMNMKLRPLLLTTLLAVWMSGAVVSAQTTQPTSSIDPINELPTSDVVAFVDARRILTEIIPRLLAKDPATLAKMTTEASDLNTKTGINILSIDRIVVGVQFIGTATHNLKKEGVGLAIIVHGDFDTDKFFAFMKSETKGKARQETYGGIVIHIEPPPTPPEKKSERETGALALLDAHTIVIGDLPQVRATIDAAAGKGRVDSALVQLATQDANTLIGMAGNVPPSLTEDISKSATPGDETEQAISKIVANIKQVFLAIGATPVAFNATLGARLGTAEQAQSLNDMLLGIRQQTAPYVQDKTARDLIDTLQITAQGNEVRISANVKNEVVEDFATSMIKDSKPTAKPATKPATTKKTTTKKRRRTRRRTH
jgi:hypothetical protein